MAAQVGPRNVFIQDLCPDVLEAQMKAKWEADLEHEVQAGWIEVRVSQDEWASGYTWWYAGTRPRLRVYERPNKPLMVTRTQPIFEWDPDLKRWVRVGPDIFEN